MALACWKCGKEIKGKVVSTNPPIFMIKLGIDFPKSFHPKCWEKVEKEAKEELENAYH